MTGQKKEHSVLEVLLNVFIGYSIAVAAQVAVLPWFGVNISFYDNMQIALFFTIISMIRQYYVRRLFNWLHIKGLL